MTKGTTNDGCLHLRKSVAAASGNLEDLGFCKSVTSQPIVKSWSLCWLSGELETCYFDTRHAELWNPGGIIEGTEV